MTEAVQLPKARAAGQQPRMAYAGTAHGAASVRTDDDADASHLGSRLRFIRHQLQMNQVTFSEAIGCSQSALASYEKSEREPPFRVVQEAARLADFSIDEFALSPEQAGRYRLRAWQQVEALRQRLIDLASLEGKPLDLDGNGWNNVITLLLLAGAQVGTNEGALQLVLALCESRSGAASE